MSKRQKILAGIIIAGIAIFFSLYKLTESPGVWYDEGFYFQSASNLALHGQTGLEVAPGIIDPSSKLITVGYPLIYPLALWFKIFGVNVLAARSLMAIFILGFLAASYFLAKKLFGSSWAIGVMAILATFPPLYGNGKSVLGEVPGMMYLVLFLICFNAVSADPNHKRFWLILSGALAGLCVVTKPIFLLLLPAIAVGCFIEWRRKSLDWKDVSIAAFFGLLPIIAWAVVQFQGGDSLQGILTYYANPYQIKDLASVILHNLKLLFGDVGTLYLVGLMCAWFISLAIRLRQHVKISAAETMSVAFSVLIVAAFLRTAGWYRYLFEAQLMALIFFPNALKVILDAIVDRYKPRFDLAKAAKITVTAVLILLAVLDIYQLMFSSWVAQAYDSHKTAYWEQYFVDLPAKTSVFFFDTPEVALFDLRGDYHQYFDPSGFEIGQTGLPLIRNGSVDEVIVRSDTYAGRTDGLFSMYKESQTIYKYSILNRTTIARTASK